MAFAYLGDIGGANNKTSGSTISGTVTANVAVGDLVVVTVASSNLSATTPTFTFSDSVGNTYTTIVQRANGFAGAGVAGAIGIALVTTPLVSGSTTVTVTLSGAVTPKIFEVFAFSGLSTATRSAAVNNAGSGTAGSVVSGTVNSGDVVIGLTCWDNTGAASALDTDTLNGSWVLLANSFTTGGSAVSNVDQAAQYKITTAAGAQTYNTTLSTISDWVSMVVVLRPIVDRTATQAGTGTSSASRLVTRPRTATSAGTGTSSASRLVTRPRTASSSGAGTSTATRNIVRSRTATSSGAGTSTAAGARAVLRSATSAGTGSSSATRVFFRARTATSSGLGSSSATRTVIRARTASSSGVGLFDSTGQITRLRTATSAGVGSSTATRLRIAIRTASSSGTGTSAASAGSVIVRVAVSSGIGTSQAFSERIFNLEVPIGPRNFRKRFYPPPSKPVSRGKPLQPPRTRW